MPLTRSPLGAAACRVTHAARLVLAATGFALAATALAQSNAAGSFEPVVGQAGKDVIWVPTPPMLVERMLRMAQVGAADTVVDLGSGDGRVAIAAAKDFGARSLGLEFNPDMVALSRREAEKAGVAGRASFEQADIYKTDFSHASVVTMYLLPNINLDMRPILLRMKPGTRVVSHQFNMGEWNPDDSADFLGRAAYLWVVPAKVGGNWRVEVAGGASYTVVIRQEFQRISGHAGPGTTTLGLRQPALWGDRISFSFVDEAGRSREFSGVVNGAAIAGEMRTDGTRAVKFAARRADD